MKKKILIWGIAATLLMPQMNLRAAALNESVTYIYHQHSGSPVTGGGCYRQPLYHIHSGDAISGGECYQNVIYHQHSGRETEPGGCYTVPVYHVHQGSSDSEGGCYIKKYHEHSTECYKQSSCDISLVKFNDCISTWYEYCYHHGETVHGKWNITVKHSSCGQGQVKITVNACNSCKSYKTKQHNYSTLDCTRENEVTGYEPGCGMDESTIVSYNAGCMKRAGIDIDRYDLSCSKTGQNIDGYGLACGIDTSEPLGGVKITNLTEGRAETVLLEASYWDSTSERTLDANNSPFLWHEASSGTSLGNSSRITVRKNGDYTVTLQLLNQDIRKDSLTASIRVENIFNGGSGSNNNGSGSNNNGSGGSNNGSGNSGSGGSGSNGGSGGSGGNNNGSGNSGNGGNSSGSGGSNSGNGGNNNGNSSNASGSENINTDVKGTTGSNGRGSSGGTMGDNSGGTGGSGSLSGGSGWKSEDSEEAYPSPGKYSSAYPGSNGFYLPDRSELSPGASPDVSEEQMLEEESGEVDQSEFESGGDDIATSMLAAEASLPWLSSPVAKAFLLVLGGLIFSILLTAAWVFLLRYVGIYGEDSEGGDCFLGFGIIRKAEGFLLVIPEHVMDRACTSRYCLRPGILFGRLHGQDELAIEVKSRKFSLPIEKEMRFKY